MIESKQYFILANRNTQNKVQTTQCNVLNNTIYFFKISLTDSNSLVLKIASKRINKKKNPKQL